jgi:hypothetical protein
MSTTPESEPQPGEHTREEMISMLFANLVIQQTNMALMLLGRVPHPETGEQIQDMDSARMFIDQLEMIQAKTKGNLNKQEEQLLQQSLTALHMAFVEAVEAGGGGTAAPAGASSEPQSRSSTPSEGAPSPAETQQPSASGEEESRKKFTKKCRQKCQQTESAGVDESVEQSHTLGSKDLLLTWEPVQAWVSRCS